MPLTWADERETRMNSNVPLAQAGEDMQVSESLAAGQL